MAFTEREDETEVEGQKHILFLSSLTKHHRA
jgi:hypothetical protein